MRNLKMDRVPQVERVTGGVENILRDIPLLDDSTDTFTPSLENLPTPYPTPLIFRMR